MLHCTLHGICKSYAKPTYSSMYKAQADLVKTLIEASGGLLVVECDLCRCSCTWALHMICICHVILTQDLISWFTGSTSIKTTAYSVFLWILNVINIKWGTYCNHSRVRQEHDFGPPQRLHMPYTFSTSLCSHIPARAETAEAVSGR